MLKKVANRKGRYFCFAELCAHNGGGLGVCKKATELVQVHFLTDDKNDVICPGFVQKNYGGKMMIKFEQLWGIKDTVLPEYQYEFNRLLLHTARKLYDKQVFDSRITALVESGYRKSNPTFTVSF